MILTKTHSFAVISNSNDFEKRTRQFRNPNNATVVTYAKILFVTALKQAKIFTLIFGIILRNIKSYVEI